MLRLHLLAACAAVTLMLMQDPCTAKPPYQHSKKHQGDFPNSPFAPPAFYDDSEDYNFRDAKWISWTPAQHDVVDAKKESAKQVGDKPNEPKTTTEIPQPKVTDKKVEEKKPEPPKFEDPCKNIYCKYGRVCEADKSGKGKCVCAGPQFCSGHSKQVCGTDSVLYPSHCELHRMACVKGTHIGIDHTGSKCTVEEVVPEKKKSEHYEIKVTKEKVNNPKVISVPKDKKSNKELSVDAQNDFEKFPEREDKYDESDYTEEGESKDQDEEEYKVMSSEVKDTEEKQGQNIDYDFKSIKEVRTPCEELEYERLKNNLLQYHCARIGELDCTSDPAKKQFVANIMFNYYDQNSDERLTEEEMADIEHRDHLEKLSRFCRLADFLTFNDREGDGNISLTEFYSAYKIPTVALDETLKVFSSIVTSGNSVELKCDIRGAVEIIWKRNGAMLDELISDDIQVFEDGSLYLKNIGLHHIGNYTCQDRYEDTVKQTHILKVQMSPKVKVNPSTQFHTSGASVTLHCHADGVPEPSIMWEMNESPLPQDLEGKHYMMLHNNATLEIKKATYTKDTGAYKCKAKNAAGAAHDIATVFIENSNVPQYSDGGSLHEVFIVFHDRGFTVYEPNHCHLEHQVLSTFAHFKYIPESEDSLTQLCKEDECSWGSAVNVRNKFIYISQPRLNRVVVIEITDRINPIEVIETDKVPVKLQYMEHLDQVWILCWNQGENTGAKTAVVVRQASEDIKHHTVHTQPIGNRFDLINDFFLPPSNDLKHEFDYGYVMHRDQQGLYKVDLRAMQYVKNIDLREYSCVPKSVAYIPMGGQVIVHCMSPLGQPDKSTRLVLDYVTDKVLEHTALGGEPFLSPDARYLVTVETDGNTISVSKLKDDGKMEHVFDEYTNLHISDVTFFPSQRGHGYDFYASASNKNDVLYIDLETGKVEMIEGVGQAMDSEEWPWNKHNRVIISGGMFGSFLMTPSKDSVIVIDGTRRAIQCQWQNIKHGNVIVWVEPMHL